MAKVGLQAPDFEGEVYFKGKFEKKTLSDFKGKYFVLFFYPLDFTFVCPTEILEFSDLADSFRDNNCEIVGCSIDSKFSHMKYCELSRDQGGLGNLKLPLLSDITKEISQKYGCYIDHGADKGVSLRATFIIDGNGIVRHISMNDLPVGRNVEEVLRLVQAFQFTDEFGDVCPSKWKKKGDVTMKPSHNEELTKNYWKNEHVKHE